MDFGVKLKRLPKYRPADGVSNTIVCYFPNFNLAKKEAAYFMFGHHSTQDGISAMAVLFSMTDNHGKHYPFMKRPEPGILGWTMMYLAFPF